jgi:hypothetical protein
LSTFIMNQDLYKSRLQSRIEVMEIHQIPYS